MSADGIAPDKAQAPEAEPATARASALRGPLTHLGALAALAVFLADQGSKLWLLFAYDLGARGVVEITPFLDLVLVWNSGISYGLFAQESALGRWFLVAVKLAASVLFWVWLARARSLVAALSLGLLIGGALGNALDRALYGAVADFVLLHAWGYNWYVFNIADVAIVVGVAGLLYDALRSGHRAA